MTRPKPKDVELHRRSARKAILRCFSNYELKCAANLQHSLANRDCIEGYVLDNWQTLLPTITLAFNHVWTRAE